jgi:hypothetical protein
MGTDTHSTESHATKNGALIEWNTRTIEDAQAERIARLEAVLRAVDGRLYSASDNEAYIPPADMAQIRRVIAAALRDVETLREAELAATQKPVRFSEREPEEGQWVLAGAADSAYWYPIQWPYSTFRTHWLPMPPAPEDANHA